MYEILKNFIFLIKILFLSINMFKLKKNMEQSCLNLTFFTCYFTTDILILLGIGHALEEVDESFGKEK